MLDPCSTPNINFFPVTDDGTDYGALNTPAPWNVQNQAAENNAQTDQLFKVVLTRAADGTLPNLYVMPDHFMIKTGRQLPAACAFPIAAPPPPAPTPAPVKPAAPPAATPAPMPAKATTKAKADDDDDDDDVKARHLLQTVTATPAPAAAAPAASKQIIAQPAAFTVSYSINGSIPVVVPPPSGTAWQQGDLTNPPPAIRPAINALEDVS